MRRAQRLRRLRQVRVSLTPWGRSQRNVASVGALLSTGQAHGSGLLELNAMEPMNRDQAAYRAWAASLRDAAPHAMRAWIQGLEHVPALLGEPALYQQLAVALLRWLFLLHAEANGVVLPSRGRAPCAQAGRHDVAPLRAEELGSRWGDLVASFELLRPCALFAASRAPHIDGDERIRLSDAAMRAAGDRLTRPSGAPLPLVQIPIELLGAAYEGLTGHTLRRVEHASLCFEPDGVLVAVHELLALDGPKRVARVQTACDRKLGARLADAVCRAETPEQLQEALRRRLHQAYPTVLPPGARVLVSSLERRRGGVHYTPPWLAREVVRETLAPLLAGAAPDAWRRLRICDPAMGTGTFLLEAHRQLCAWAQQQVDSAHSASVQAEVARTCLYGVDLDPLAVDVARLSLQLHVAACGGVLPAVDHNLRCGDALLGLSRHELVRARWGAASAEAWALDPGYPVLERELEEASELRTAARCEPRPPDSACARTCLVGDALIAAFFEESDARARRDALGKMEARLARVLSQQDGQSLRSSVDEMLGRRRQRPFHWPVEFPEVLDASGGGFDAFVGNPPWVAYAGRAAQPLSSERFDFYLATNPGFHGYRTLHGLFLVRCASLLRPGGRLGLVVPTSVSDLQGYAAVRRAHDAMSDVDAELPDFGADAFDGVFQPAMAVLSTRRAQGALKTPPKVATWKLARSDLQPWESALLERMERVGCVPPEAFAERGLQTTGRDRDQLRPLGDPGAEAGTPIREGTDLRAFAALPPRLVVMADALERGLRPASEWCAVHVLVRQTARYPIAALGDGTAFRNSVLAGFAVGRWTRYALVAYLNAGPVRWLHYMRFRDARQGMPQVKVAHLRATPDVPVDALDPLTQIGKVLGARNAGVTEAEQRELDSVVAHAWGLSNEQLERIRCWASAHPAP